MVQYGARMPGELRIPTVDEVNAMLRTSFPGSENECAEIGHGYAVARRRAQPADIRPGGYVSGPAQFGVADSSLWYCVFAAIGRVEPMALTSELSIRFLRPCVGDVVWARATVDTAGRRNIVGTVRVWGGDNPEKATAVAQGTYVLPATPTIPD
jgi:uncharacterized protein (TIGR00369 family)